MNGIETAGQVSTEVVFIVGPAQEGRELVMEILRRGEWRWEEVSGQCEALERLRRIAPVLIIRGQEPEDHTWRELLAEIDKLKLAQAPRLMVVSRLAGEPLWAEVLTLGGFSLALTAAG